MSTPPLFDKSDVNAYVDWYAKNGKDLRALGLAGSRYGLGIVDPVPVAENFITGVPAAIGSENHPLHALNYERAQYESAMVYSSMVASGYNCYAICSENPNYQNGSEYITQGAKYTGTSTIQLGHSFMNYLARLGGQPYAPTVFDYTRDAAGNMVSTATVLKDFFAPIAEDIVYNCSIGSTVVDYIGKNENGNFEFIQDAATITLNVAGVNYTTAQVATKEGATSSYTFTAPGASEPTFWLDYYGDGETTEHFVWTFGENVSTENQAKLTYKLQLTEKQEVAGEYIVPTNNSATLYPVDSKGQNGEPQVFPVPEVDYTVEEKPEEPEEPEEEPEKPTVSFKSGQASNISFMLIDAQGNVEFLYKVDIEDETSFEIPTEAGKVSAVFVKQSTSGLFWTSQEVDEDIQAAVIQCLKDNNPSYKGHNAFVSGEGDHTWEFKKGKTATYTFANISDEQVVFEIPAEEIAEEPVEETEPEATEPEATEPAPHVYTVKGATETARKTIGNITVIYIAADGKIPAVIWSSEALDAATVDALIAEFGAGSDVKVLSGVGAHTIEYPHNKNKTKTVTYIFE